MASKRKTQDAEIFAASQGAFQYDAKLRHNTNDSVWVSRTITPMKDQHGIQIGFRGSDTDISERKFAEEQFKQFKIISDQSNHGTAITTVDGLVIYCNNSFANMHGYTPEELAGKPLTIFHNESQLPRVVELVEGIKSKGGFDAEVVDHARKDGSSFPALMSAKLIHDEDGNPSFLSATLIDISDRMLAEQEVRKLTVAVEQSPAPTIITDVDGNFIYANPAFVTTTGYERHEIYGKSTRILKSGQTPKEVYVHMWKKIKAGQIWSGEILNRKKNKELYWELLTISPIFDTNGSIINFLAIKQDVTERKKTEQEIRELNSSLEQKVQERTQELWTSNKELIEAKELAEKANHAKSDFLSRMSHELRTPMNSILGFSQLLEMSQLDDRQRKNVKQILSSGNHLLGLINEVLDIARIESGHQTLSVEPLEVNAVLSDCIDILRPSADKRNIVIKFNHTKGDSVYVNADLQRTQQILLNLMNNSLKYNVEGGTVDVGYEYPVGSDNKFTRIYVSDTGIGINSEYLEKIFEPFERVGAEKGSIEGTGLGLAVVKQLVTLMKGEVGVISEAGKGSKFWIDLPTVSGGINTGMQTAAESQLKSGLHKSQGKVLYVEDNPANIELVDQIVGTQRPNIDLITDNTGLNVVQKAEVYTPDLILLDLNLPEILGSEIVKQLKGMSATAHIPIVVLSADALPTQIKYLKSLGAADYLTKPIQVPQLLQVLDQYCKHNPDN
jgi:PAS domain S-box-containing protein